MTQLSNAQVNALAAFKPELGTANKYDIDTEGYYRLYNANDELIAILSFVLFKKLTINPEE